MSEEKPVKMDEAEEEREEEEVEVVEERLYTFPFRKVWATPRGKRTPRAVRMLKEYVRRHMKVDTVIISNEINEQIWSRGISKPPRSLKIRVVKDKEGKVIVYPPKVE
jgi:large subunit ribosomal protein L31e